MSNKLGRPLTLNNELREGFDHSDGPSCYLLLITCYLLLGSEYVSREPDGKRASVGQEEVLDDLATERGDEKAVR